MEITSMKAFLKYYEKTRQQTLRVVAAIPQDKYDWTYKPGKFSLGDLVRHIASIERNLFAEVVMGNKPNYRGCGKEIAIGYDTVLDYLNAMHTESIDIFQNISDDSLQQVIQSLDGKDIELGSFLRALPVHEIHHRGAMCIYLNLLGIESPPVLGLKEEQLIVKS